jgi:hypothetical protein
VKIDKCGYAIINGAEIFGRRIGKNEIEDIET